MANQHPITPPPELIEQWQDESPETQIADHVQYLATRAAQWGADQELEACCHEVQTMYSGGSRLRAARRPKPPSLKEQALKQLRDMDQAGALDCNTDKIRAALEALPNV
jgi:hypothetical protein